MIAASQTVKFVFTAALLSWLVLAWSHSIASEVTPGNSYGAKLSEKPDWFKDSFLEFEEDVADARDQNKRLMIYFHQEGCPYCARLVSENFSDPVTRKLIQQNFDSIAINIWGDREIVSVAGQNFSEKTFAAALKVQYTPTLLFLDERGQVALRLDGYFPPQQFRQALDYVAAKMEKKQKFSEYRLALLTEREGKLLTEDFYLNERKLDQLLKASGKPLAVYFEAPDCAECETMHKQILADPVTRELVQQAANVQLNINSKEAIVSPAGKSTTAIDWAKELDIAYTPSVLFFDSNGNEIMRIGGFVKTFHFQSVYAYVLEKAYLRQPAFQRYIAARAEQIREMGFDTNIWGYQSFH